MTRPEFEFAPFEFEEAQPAWEAELRRGPASHLSARTSPGRPRPPARRTRPEAAHFDPRPRPCFCPVHGTEFIRWVQSTLNRVNAARLPVDGIMSAATRSALRDFQRRMGLPLDGIAGPEVEQALRDARRDAGAGGRAGNPAPPPHAGETFAFETLDFESAPAMPTLRRSASGPAVSELQRRLAGAGFSPGTVDGLFGSRTEAAVRAYQRARGLGVDGIVGAQTWAALLGSGAVLPPAPGPTAPTPAPAPASPGNDPSIEALNLADAARSAAYTVKARHPWVRFTSGRRDVPGQASAMAGNVLLNRQWIEQTYADNAVSKAAQAWVDAHPEARSKEAIAAGLLGVLRGFSSADLGRLSYHLSGLAFDIQPVSGQLAAISSTINGLPRLKEFLTREGGLERWHVALA